MRKLTVGMKLSLDGYIAAPGDDLGWSVPSERAVPVVVGAAAPGSPRRRLADLDIMQWVAGINTDPAYAELAGAAIAGELDGIPLRVCGLDHLMALERAAGRPRDLDDLQRLGAT